MLTATSKSLRKAWIDVFMVARSSHYYRPCFNDKRDHTRAKFRQPFHHVRHSEDVRPGFSDWRDNDLSQENASLVIETNERKYLTNVSRMLKRLIGLK